MTRRAAADQGIEEGRHSLAVRGRLSSPVQIPARGSQAAVATAATPQHPAVT